MIVPNKLNVKTVTDMRQDPVGLLKSVHQSDGPQYIFYRSSPQAVLLGLENYQKLLDLSEDYLDSLTAQEYEKENKKKTGWLTARKIRQKLGL